MHKHWKQTNQNVLITFQQKSGTNQHDQPKGENSKPKWERQLTECLITPTQIISADCLQSTQEELHLRSLVGWNPPILRLG